MLQENNPDAACMHHTKEKEEGCIVLRLGMNKGKSFAHYHLLVVVKDTVAVATTSDSLSLIHI